MTQEAIMTIILSTSFVGLTLIGLWFFERIAYNAHKENGERIPTLFRFSD